MVYSAQCTPQEAGGHSASTATLHTDASPQGWGGVYNCTLPAHGFWRAAQRRLHISELELRAVRYTVESFLEELRGKDVRLCKYLSDPYLANVGVRMCNSCYRALAKKICTTPEKNLKINSVFLK